MTRSVISLLALLPIASPSWANDPPTTRRETQAVANALTWLAANQKPDGSWAFDGSDKADTAGATGLAVLTFLGAGRSHKPSADVIASKEVERGLKFLITRQRKDGSFPDSSATGRAFAATALAEGYSLTR